MPLQSLLSFLSTTIRRVDLLNRGLSGYNSRMLLPALPHLVSPELLGRASMITLMLGSNDASLPDTNPEQAVPLEEFGDNLLRYTAQQCTLTAETTRSNSLVTMLTTVLPFSVTPLL